MVNLGELILRKFKNIAGSRYEEIIRAYQEFFLTEEELKIPVISSILLVVDRFSPEPPNELYEVLVSYPSAIVKVVYIIDEAIYSIIRETLGESGARKFRDTEETYGKETLNKISSKLSELGINFTTELIFAEKATFVEDAVREHDLLAISKHFGSESLKTHTLSPLVFRIMQRIEKPVVIY